MTIDSNAIIKLIVDVMGERQIQITATQSLKGALMTGTCSLVGGIVAGPVGLAVGGAAGGCLAAFTTKGTFKPIGQVLNELSFETKEQIAAEIETIIEKLEINDLTQFVQIALVCSSLAQPRNILVQRFIEQSIPVIQRHIFLESSTNSALN